MALAGVAAAVALVVVVASAISERPMPQLRLAVVPAVAVLVVGQLWTMIVIIRRRQWLSMGLGEVKELFFSPLPRRIDLGIFAVFVVGWLSAATAALALTNGVPSATGRPACPYPAYYHGSMVCISKAAWQSAVAAEERAGAGVMPGFFVAHFGVAWSKVRRSRQERARAGSG